MVFLDSKYEKQLEYLEYRGHVHINIYPVALAITKYPMQICKAVSKQDFKMVPCKCNSCFSHSRLLICMVLAKSNCHICQAWSEIADTVGS